VRSTLFLCLFALLFAHAACVSTPRFPEAANAWQRGQRPKALSLARAEYERFRVGNDLDANAIETSLGELSEALRTMPVVLDGDGLPPSSQDPDSERPTTEVPESDGDDEQAMLERRAPPLLRATMESTLRRDLSASGAVRVIRAASSVTRLGIDRFGVELLAIIWHRDPFSTDHRLVQDQSAALRSLTVKLAALKALEATGR